MANSFVKGIVIKQSAYGDGHRILSIFGEGTGIIKAISYGAGKSKSSNAASSLALSISEGVLSGLTLHPKTIAQS